MSDLREAARALGARITEYLMAGGFFNPESMDHAKVRRLLLDSRRFVDEVLAAEEGRVSEWRPIESAPKDGARVLLATPSGKIADGFWGNYGAWVWPYVMVEPTHWMFSPEPPMIAAAEKEQACPTRQP